MFQCPSINSIVLLGGEDTPDRYLFALPRLNVGGLYKQSQSLIPSGNKPFQYLSFNSVTAGDKGNNVPMSHINSVAPRG